MSCFVCVISRNPNFKMSTHGEQLVFVSSVFTVELFFGTFLVLMAPIHEDESMMESTQERFKLSFFLFWKTERSQVSLNNNNTLNCIAQWSLFRVLTMCSEPQLGLGRKGDQTTFELLLLRYANAGSHVIV